jgi:hypothetical protein
VRASQAARFADVTLVDQVLALDQQWRDGEAVSLLHEQLASGNDTATAL